MIRLILAGATGWAGAELARAVAHTGDIALVGAVSRKSAGKKLGDALSEPRLECVVSSSAVEALETPCDVFFEYTKPESAKANILAALQNNAHVVVGTSGLTDADYAEIDQVAKERRRGVLACGNFALTVVLLQRFAEQAAKYIPDFEVIDYAHHDKPDAPSGTARELASRLGPIREPPTVKPVGEVRGPREARGADIAGVRVLSLRSPGYVIGLEVVFGMSDQRLHLKHEAGSSARPYVDGALLGIRKVGKLVGVHRGLDRVMDE
jgi:4-hydroxy-tetrahydrodipicolinate reductase